MTGNSRKVALITGGTDGIGKATALELAKHGYTLHVLGRSKVRGERALADARRLGPDAAHELLLVDLADLEAVNAFLREYARSYDRLDLLVLNANAWVPNISVSSVGVDVVFTVGYLSRYLFSIRLNPLLEAGKDARVVHVSDARMIREIDYARLSRPDYGILKATLQSYAASALLAYFLNALDMTPVPHETMDPGVVNTRQIKERNIVVRALARLGGLLEPEESGRRIVQHILQTRARDVASRYYSLEKEKKLPEKLTGGNARFERLVAYSERVTGVSLTEIRARADPVRR